MNYEPGTVAVATVRGVPNVTVMRCTNEFWWSAAYTADNRMHGDGDVTDVRPLVVLDLDPALGRSAVVAMRGAVIRGESPLLKGIADQIEAQTKPPRIPEPGLWGVVSIDGKDGHTYYWTHGYGGWFNEAGSLAQWADLVDPVLVRPGVEDES